MMGKFWFDTLDRFVISGQTVREKSVSLYFGFFFWCVSVFVVVAVCPMIALAFPRDCDNFARPTYLFELV
jgi:hypothetical protein